MFYSAGSLELKKVSHNTTPPHPIPSLEYPSDHLPISAMFQFRSLQQHINCVRALQGEPSFRRQSAFNTNFEEEQAVTSSGSVE